MGWRGCYPEVVHPCSIYRDRHHMTSTPPSTHTHSNTQTQMCPHAQREDWIEHSHPDLWPAGNKKSSGRAKGETCCVWLCEREDKGGLFINVLESILACTKERRTFQKVDVVHFVKYVFPVKPKSKAILVDGRKLSNHYSVWLCRANLWHFY